MKFFVYTASAAYQSDETLEYHLVVAEDALRASCKYATNEESLFGTCDPEYRVYDGFGKFLGLFPTASRHQLVQPSQDPRESNPCDPTCSCGDDEPEGGCW